MGRCTSAKVIFIMKLSENNDINKSKQLNVLRKCCASFRFKRDWHLCELPGFYCVISFCYLPKTPLVDILTCLRINQRL